MPDNTTLNPGIGGDVARSIDRAGVKTQVVAIDLGGEAGPENLLGAGGMPITAAALPLPPLQPPAHRSAMTKPAALKPPAAPGATCNEP